MFKILIIDDEPVVREGLKTFIDWETFGFTICGYGVNGKDGYEKIMKLKPDLVIVDVKMPVMDGLQMIEKLHNEKDKPKFIILTGFSYFEYAQKALKYGVKAYLVKPIEEQDLIEEITKIYDELNREKLLMDTSTIFSKEKILEEIVFGYFKTSDIRQFNMIFNFGFPWDSYRVALIKFDKNCNSAGLIKIQIKNEIKGYIELNNLGYSFETNRMFVILLRNGELELINNMLKVLMKKLAKLTEESGLAVIGRAVAKIEDVYLSYQNALEMIDKEFFFSNDVVINEEMVKRTVNNEAELLICSSISSLITYVEQHNDLKIIEKTNFIRQQLMSFDLTKETIKAYYMSIYMTLLNQLSLKYEKLQDMICKQKSIFKDIQFSSTMDEVHNAFQNQLMYLSKILLEKKSANVMDNVLAYIHKNLDKDLKLESLAQIFSYNSAYLGKMFKSYTGEYFNKYLDNVRMEKARILLEEGFKVYEAAEKVGYSNISYFYSKFKKYTGLSPGTIRGFAN